MEDFACFSCRTFIGTNLSPAWERFLAPDVGKIVELVKPFVKKRYLVVSPS